MIRCITISIKDKDGKVIEESKLYGDASLMVGIFDHLKNELQSYDESND